MLLIDGYKIEQKRKRIGGRAMGHFVGEIGGSRVREPKGLKHPDKGCPQAKEEGYEGKCIGCTLARCLEG